MSNELDRNRYYAIVYGDPIMKYYQDGTYFKRDGKPINTSKTPSAEKEPHKAVVVEQEPEKKADDADNLRLKAMHIQKLKKLAVKVAEATGVEHPELSGKGLKAKLIAYIADNTE
jgi:hypothetical protein